MPGLDAIDPARPVAVNLAADPDLPRGAEITARTPLAEPDQAATLVVLVCDAEGLPVPDLTVLASPRLVIDDWADEASAATDARGEARFELAPGAYRCRTAVGGEVRVELLVAEQRRVTIRLPGGPPVAGAVVDADGRGIAAAEVLMSLGAGRAHTVAHTDARGEFQFAGPDGDGWIAARHAEHAPSPPQHLQRRFDRWDRVTIVLHRDRGRLRGLVLDADGRPATDATVLVGSENRREYADGSRRYGPPLQRVEVRDDGTFATPPLPPGSVTLLATAPRSAAVRATATVTRGADTEVRLQLTAGASVAGTIRTPDGQPARDTFVWSGERRSFGSRLALTDAAGRFVLEGLPSGAVGLTALQRAPDGGDHRAETTLQLLAGTTANWDATLTGDDDAALFGRVIDHLGAALPGWLVLATPTGERRGYGCESADDGAFRLRDVPATLEVTLTAHPASAGWSSFAAVTVGPLRGATASPVTLQVPDPQLACGAIRGRVLADGGPGAAATLALTRVECGTLASYGTADDGRFELQLLPPGTYRAVVQSREHPHLRVPAFELAAGATVDLGDLQLDRGGRVRGRLLGPNGQPAAGVVCRVVDTREADAGLCENSDSEYRTPLLPAGDYTLLLQGNDIAAQRVALRVVRDEERTVDVQLRPGLLHRIRVTTRDPRDQAAMVSIILLDDERRPVWAAHLPMHQGTAQFHTCLAPGRYSVTALGVRDQRASGAFAVDPAAAPDDSLTVLELQPPAPR
ncbi:MAG: carboxypeptidase regulatory-like domain-containing protein [Planctomycetota bacterium]